MHPGRSLYQRHLADAAAVLLASAANAEADADPDDEATQADIKLMKVSARGIIQANKLLDQAMADDYKFSVSELRPQLTQPTQPTNDPTEPASKPAIPNTI